MSVILKIDPSKKDVIINNNHNGITINNNNVPKREFPALGGLIRRNVVNLEEFENEFTLMMSCRRLFC